MAYLDQGHCVFRCVALVTHFFMWEGIVMRILLGAVVIFQGLLWGTDTLLTYWGASPDYAAYGASYASVRLAGWPIEAGAAAVFCLLGILLVAAGLRSRKRCPACGQWVKKDQPYCGQCGQRLCE